MKPFAFLKKELKEILRTPKIFILPSIFLIFGFASPLLAKSMPELLKALVSDFPIPVKEPTYIDSYAQFFKNMGQIGIIVVILTFMSSIVEEKVKGSAILVLTKRVSRTQFIVSKLTAALLLFTGAYILASAACIYYTHLLFPIFYSSGLMEAFLLFWMYGVFILCTTMLASTVARSHTMAAVLAFLIFALMSAGSAIPRVGEYFPSYLGSVNMQILIGSKNWSDAAASLLSAALVSVAMVTATIQIFKRQEI